MLRPLFIAAIATALTACGGGSSDGGQASALDANWSQSGLVVGSQLNMNLTVDGTRVSGTGNWAGEAGPSGTLSVTGTANGGNLVATLNFSNGHQAVFTGALVDASHLKGTLSYDSSTPSDVSFVKS